MWERGTRASWTKGAHNHSSEIGPGYGLGVILRHSIRGFNSLSRKNLTNGILDSLAHQTTIPWVKRTGIQVSTIMSDTPIPGDAAPSPLASQHTQSLPI